MKVVDMHCDTISEIDERRKKGENLDLRKNGGNIRESENTDSFFSDDFNWIFYCSLGVCH